jgi:hypothetical protein
MSTFIAPHKAIQAHVDRAYSIHVMYRPAIKAPRPITLQPKIEAAPVIATVPQPDYREGL